MVFGMIGKYIRQLKLKELQQPPVALNNHELQSLNNIRMILMNKAQIPEDFEHVGSENSDEEDQFYKYRNELVDIFKNSLDIHGSKENVINELSLCFHNLTNMTSVEKIELLFFLLFHFAEKVSEISLLLKSQNVYSELIEYIIKFPIPSHKIILKMYFENIIRYSGFFDTPEHFPLFHYPLNHFLLHINNQDKNIKKHTIYMLYRLAIKNCSCLVHNVESILQVIFQCLETELDQESTNYLYKTIGLIIGNKNINPTAQFSLFSNLCDMICRNPSQETVTIFTEVLSGFNKKVNAEMIEKLKQSAGIILKASFTGDKSMESLKYICLLLQKLIDTLEEDSAIYIKAGLDYLIDNINIESIEIFLQVLGNCCHKIKTNLADCLPIKKLQGFIVNVIENIHSPNETISDIAQQSIAARRSLVRSLDILILSIPEIFDFQEFPALINYVGEMACNFIESSSPKIALIFLGKLINNIAVKNPEHDISTYIIETCYQISTEIIMKKKIHAINPDILQTAAELINLHKSMLGYEKTIGKEEDFYQSLSRFIMSFNLENYASTLRIIVSSDQKTSHDKALILKSLIIEMIEMNKNS